MNQVQFQIDQLRKDKIIYAIESIAISVACIAIVLVSHQYLTDNK